MAKLVDAQDLKSCGSQIPCRFKSGLRHHYFFGGIPKLVEGTGLENQQVVQAALGFESLFLLHLFIKYIYRGVEQFGSSSGS